MPISDHERVSTTSLALLRPLLIALDASDSAVTGPFAGLPSPCIRCPAISTVICATPVTSVRLFRPRMVAAACENDVDILLIRHGLAPEILDEVTVDAVMHRRSPLDVFSGMVTYRGIDSDL
ncbi:hypothetical protein HZF05_13765 [Sphingomonas sp. CGMCC 1.13654]|uniref:Uncharacterized protein n=1 Tax=Sphingomonas chungangi TaxID=2683589 RepID=A0A838L8R9_9SPHN|nr:hypothetical protein [Sphingomonas chungangi]MBA2935152.1 hypothetical protein [Sphingomonas chungangi]MVW57716.1 hypothetical protein [Sphingomonas chungangi]